MATGNFTNNPAAQAHLGEKANSVDNAIVYNPKDPPKSITFTVNAKGDKMTVDGKLLNLAAEKIGAQAGDVLSIGGFRDDRGGYKPLYSTVQIERRASDEGNPL
jgi:hypothetical protein